MGNAYLFLMDVKHIFEFTENKCKKNACVNENVVIL